ncbi:hypothetical protein CHS0354_010151 [Potamilus streckersoni]|uniref:ATR-interacting protein n=1 Tax=Potamilus streckersoni TaxID=2493646 RepID=A0AAE0S3P2_9BIVA|nr:hypothetical protein CHS0354_010151 [Potamilus streckersoni]
MKRRGFDCDVKGRPRERQQLGGIPGHYKPLPHPPQSQTEASIKPSEEAPPSKRVKTEKMPGQEYGQGKDAEDLWDDSLELTQADLDDMETLTSQAYSQLPQKTTGIARSGPSSEPIPSTSGVGRFTSVHREESKLGPFLKPYLHSSSSLSSSVNGHSSNTSYDPASTSYSGNSRSSESIKSGASIEVSLGQRRLSLQQVDSSDGSTFLKKKGSLVEAVQEELNKCKTECDRLKSENIRAKEDLCAKEGEIKLLRDSLHRKENEVGQFKMDQFNQSEQLRKEHIEKERALQTEINKLKTQLQFKEHEQGEAVDRYRELESQLRAFKSGQSTAFPIASQPSPKRRKVVVQEKSPKSSHTGFPTTKSFHAQEGSPTKEESSTCSSKTLTETGTMTEDATARKRRLNLRLKGFEDQQSGAHLVASLIEVRPDASGKVSDRGIVGLLHTPSTFVHLQNVRFERDTSSFLLSPTGQKRRLSELKNITSVQAGKQDFMTIVSDDHYYLALQGLTCLLQGENLLSPITCPRPPSASTSTAETSVANKRINYLSSAQNCTLLILPLLNDYLTHYLDMLRSSTENLNSTSPSTSINSSKSSSSFESPLDSITSSLNMLLRDSAVFANNLEQLALTSLRVLHKLVSVCPAVQNVILEKHESADSRTETEKKEIDKKKLNKGEETEAESMQSSGSHSACPVTRQFLHSQNLLEKIRKLANPGEKGHLSNTEVIKAALNVLTELAEHADEDQMECLLPVLSDEILLNCLEYETEQTVVLQGLYLLRALTRSNLMVSSFCKNSADCVLSVLYTSCLNVRQEDDISPIQMKMYYVIIEIMSNITGSHRGGRVIILESDCNCSLQIIQTLILILHSVMVFYQSKRSRTSLELLQKGLQFLHLLYQHDTNFMDHRFKVEHHYVNLISELTQIFKTLSDKEEELSDLAELEDFNQEDSEEENSIMETG